MTARVQPSDIVQGLEAGADSLTKPVDDLALITRVRNLGRLKTMNDEFLMRFKTRPSCSGSTPAHLWRSPQVSVSPHWNTRATFRSRFSGAQIALCTLPNEPAATVSYSERLEKSADE